jgi:peptidoglycan/LPS O-acetylase OafA/YrhL
MHKKIHYFESLSALRFFAAFLVVIHHAETIRLNYNMFNFKQYSLFNNGGFAVSFFFVLSGFLITYLLLREKESTNKISIRKFYLRRILRIWPLYYLLVFIGTILLPCILIYFSSNVHVPYSFGEVILYYMFFAPFMVNVFYGHHFLEPLWSIGVEEIFYLIWAPLLKFFHDNTLTIILLIIIIKVSIMVIMFHFFQETILFEVLSLLKFEAMAIGGLGAYLLFNSNRDLSTLIIFKRPFQVFMFLLLVLKITAFKYISVNGGFMSFAFNTPLLSNFIFNFIFLWLILNISLNKLKIFSLNSKVLIFLGDISYGIYMYHMLVIFAVILFASNFLNSINNLYSTTVFYSISLFLILLISFISKIFFEDKFLKLKKNV